MKTEKKVYPSELNTKSIACRIPMSDYVEIMNECINNSITINDWLLMKLYEKKNSINNITSVSNNQQIETWKEDSERLNYYLENNKLMTFPHAFMRNGNMVEFKCASDLQEWMMDYFSNNNYKKTASIEDIKSQLTILISNKFNTRKERTSFLNDILPLLKELE
jgi:hypothetical protein